MNSSSPAGRCTRQKPPPEGTLGILVPTATQINLWGGGAGAPQRATCAPSRRWPHRRAGPEGLFWPHGRGHQPRLPICARAGSLKRGFVHATCGVDTWPRQTGTLRVPAAGGAL
eukprot:gene15146-biopygen23168